MKQSSLSNEINGRYLEWDSNFLGFPVWEMSLSEKSDERQIKKTIEDKRKIGVRLIYANIYGGNILSAGTLERQGGVLVDRKLTFSKSLDLRLPRSAYPNGELKKITRENITTKPYEQKLIELAWEAGHFSRFRLDPKFSELKFKELYRTWLVRSLSGEMAKMVLVKENKLGIPVGFVSVNVVGNTGVIGLIAVDSSSRGQGFGGELVRGALDEMRDLQASEAQVVTQRENHPACQLYHRSGFVISSEVERYHFWL